MALAAILPFTSPNLPLASSLYGALGSTAGAAAAVDLAHIQAHAYTHVQDTWPSVSSAATASNNATAIATAPYHLASDYIGALAGVASKPGSTTTSSSNGFFGIGGGTSTSYTPDPAAIAAGNQLTNGNFLGFLPGH